MAFATIPDSNGVVHLCYKDNGELRVIDTAAPKTNDRSCRNNETALEIDQHGTPGPVGSDLPGPRAQGRHRRDRTDGRHRRRGGDRRTGSEGRHGRSGPEGRHWRGGPLGQQGPLGRRATPARPAPLGPGRCGPTFAATAPVSAAAQERRRPSSGRGLPRHLPAGRDDLRLSISSAQYLGVGIIGVNSSTTDPPDISHAFFTVVQDVGTANSLVVGERDAASRASVEGPFSIEMICP